MYQTLNILFSVAHNLAYNGFGICSMPHTQTVRQHAMIGENRQLVTYGPVEVQDCKKITDQFRGIYTIYPNLIKESRRTSTCNRLDLQTLGSQPFMWVLNYINEMFRKLRKET